MLFQPRPETITPRRAVQLIVLATVSVVLIAGVVVWLFDRQDFPSLGLAWWWALQTATTIGYGDIVPRSVTGRLVGAALMVESTAFIAITTAGITSALVNRARHHSEAPAVAALADRVDEIDERLARIELVLRQIHLATVHEDRPQDDDVERDDQ